MKSSVRFYTCNTLKFALSALQVLSVHIWIMTATLVRKNASYKVIYFYVGCGDHLFFGYAWLHMSLIPALWKQRQVDLCDFEVSLVYIVSSLKKIQKKKNIALAQLTVSSPQIQKWLNLYTLYCCWVFCLFLLWFRFVLRQAFSGFKFTILLTKSFKCKDYRLYWQTRL